MEQLELSCNTEIDVAKIDTHTNVMTFKVTRKCPSRDLYASKLEMDIDRNRTGYVEELQAQMLLKQVIQLRNWLNQVIEEAKDAREKLFVE